MIEIKTMEPQATLTIRTTTTAKGIGMACSEVLPEVFRYIQAAGWQTASPPFVLYHSFSPEVVDMEGGLAVTESRSGDGRIKSGTLPGGRAAVLWHIGPYDDLHRTHTALQDYCRQNGGAAGPCWEVYWTDPGREPDPQKWKTEVLYLLES